MTVENLLNPAVIRFLFVSSVIYLHVLTQQFFILRFPLPEQPLRPMLQQLQQLRQLPLQLA